MIWPSSSWSGLHIVLANGIALKGSGTTSSRHRVTVIWYNNGSLKWHVLTRAKSVQIGLPRLKSVKIGLAD